MRTPSPADRALVDDVIFGELTQGRLVDSSRAEYVRIIDDCAVTAAMPWR